ncbi:MAG: family 20 glycosylhydrolase [bacterium]
MKTILFLTLTTSLVLGSTLMASIPDESPISIIPKPAKLELKSGSFLLSLKTVIAYDFSKKDQKATVEYCAKRFRIVTGWPFKLVDAAKLPKENYILFQASNDQPLGDEGYRMEVGEKSVIITAQKSAGFFYGVQSLFQLLPPEVFSTKRIKGVEWKLPCVSIEDQPRFQWRGMHLDVSRHFLPKSFIKTYIDMIALHKMNVFHWHLTDDQGWRIEIKKYPKLTSIGAWRVDRENQNWNFREPRKAGEKANYGGFYTQKEIKEIVQYAASKHITVVPEIEMPAHTQAVLAAYPQYSCIGGPFEVPPGGVWPITNIYCAGKDETFTFIQNILDEVIRLFPSTFIHIGGDEADKTEWKKCPRCQARIKKEGLKDEAELQSYFIKRIEKYIVSKGRKLIGWDEILEGGLAPEATVMSWRGTEGGIAAARQGHDVVMTPGSHCYFDYYQGKPDFEPLAIGGYTTLSRVYEYEPVPSELTPEQAKYILGAQANVWTEYIPSPEHAQYMTMPRMAAMAEVVWSPKEARDWQDFAKRIVHQLKRYDALNYNYARSAYLVNIATALDAEKKQMGIALSSELPVEEILYTLDGSEPGSASLRYEKPIILTASGTVKARSLVQGKMLTVSEQKVSLHAAIFKPVNIKYPYERYTGGGEYGLTNGVFGTLTYGDGNWQGYHQSDLEAVVDLGEIRTIAQLSTRFLENINSWIFLPTLVEYAISEDGDNFTTVGKFEFETPTSVREPSIKELPVTLGGKKARYIKVFAKNVGLCPDWHSGKGEKAWLFVDEIVVE